MEPRRISNTYIENTIIHVAVLEHYLFPQGDTKNVTYSTDGSVLDCGLFVSGSLNYIKGEATAGEIRIEGTHGTIYGTEVYAIIRALEKFLYDIS